MKVEVIRSSAGCDSHMPDRYTSTTEQVTEVLIMTLETRLPRLAKSFSPVQLRAHLSQPSPTPLLLSDLIPEADWPASRSWSLTNGLSRLRSVIGENREVDVELGPRGRGYLDKGYKRIGMGFGEPLLSFIRNAILDSDITIGLFLDAFILDRIPSSIPLHQRPTGYLAQYDLDPGSELATIDAPVLPHYTCGPRSEIWRRALWIGPGGSWTPFHRDPYINIYTHREYSENQRCS